MGDVGGVQLIEPALQLGQVLPVHQVFHPVVMRAFLTMGQVFDQLVPMQQLNHLGEAVLQAFLRLLGFYFSHGTLHPQRRRTPKRVNQSVRDCTIEIQSNYWVSPWW
ncbi:hypothetical protein D3C86_1246270 [compost metagenome]